MPAALTDLCVSSSYKWMLSTHGAAACYLSERAEASIQPSSFGWRNLDIFPTEKPERAPEVDTRSMPYMLEPGNPAMLVIALLDGALEILLETGIDRIEAHARDLAEYIDDGLSSIGKKVISQRRREARSGNTCFQAEDAAGVEKRLADQGVFVWGESGRVRVSGHLYNGSTDVDTLIKTLGDMK